MTPRIGTAVTDRHGVALDGRLRNEDTELASTTLYDYFFLFCKLLFIINIFSRYLNAGWLALMTVTVSVSS